MKSFGSVLSFTRERNAALLKAYREEINAVDFGTKDVDLFGNGNLSPEASMKKMFEKIKKNVDDYYRLLLFLS